MVLPQHLVVQNPQGPKVDQELVAHLEVVEALLQQLLLLSELLQQLLLLSELLLLLSVEGGLAAAAAFAAAAVAVAPPLLPLPLPLCRSSSLLRCRLEPRRLLLDQRPQEGGLVLRLAQERGGLALGQLRSSSSSDPVGVVPPEEAGKRPHAASALRPPPDVFSSAPDLSLYLCRIK